MSANSTTGPWMVESDGCQCNSTSKNSLAYTLGIYASEDEALAAADDANNDVST